ncbi:MAG: hypothetical protein L0Y42_05480, partial [Phycisphaerales bacterium]|nr:hypothetical protein [Phycisphaerales bacterium]
MRRPSSANDWKNVNADFTRRVYTHFDVRPDQVYGYVPPRDDDDRSNKDQLGGGGDGGNWLPDSPYGQKFNLSSIQTIRGRVQSIQRFRPMSDMAEGVRVMVKTDDNQTIEVHLGPAWFIERQQMQFKEGDEVRVIGSRVQIDGKPVIMASEVWR